MSICYNECKKTVRWGAKLGVDYKLVDREDFHLSKMKESNSDVVIGASHHTPEGIRTLPCKDHTLFRRERRLSCQVLSR